MGVIDEKHPEIVSKKKLKKIIKDKELKKLVDDGKTSDDEITNSDDETKNKNQSEDEKEGWADAMSKILAKTGPKNAKTMVLAKTKKVEEDIEAKKERLKRKTALKKKREWEDIHYHKPDVLQKDYERTLQKTATRGVVQLFNAVRKHQTDVEEKLKEAKTEHKKEKLFKNIDKKAFLKMLNPGSNGPADEEKSAEEEKPAWKVLRDDFMLGNSMKDWDKKDDEISKKKLKVK